MTTENTTDHAQQMVKDWSEAYWDADPQTATLLRVLNDNITEEQVEQIRQIHSVAVKCSKGLDEETERCLLEKI